jgi:hypothetical protein
LIPSAIKSSAELSSKIEKIQGSLNTSSEQILEISRKINELQIGSSAIGRSISEDIGGSIFKILESQQAAQNLCLKEHREVHRETIEELKALLSIELQRELHDGFARSKDESCAFSRLLDIDSHRINQHEWVRLEERMYDLGLLSPQYVQTIPESDALEREITNLEEYILVEKSKMRDQLMKM